MGLDAFVRCRCFEEGRVSQPPVPMEDLYVDEEGYIASRTLCSEYERLGYKMFYERMVNWKINCVRGAKLVVATRTCVYVMSGFAT